MRTDYHSDVLAKAGAPQPEPPYANPGPDAARKPTLKECEANLRWQCFHFAVDICRGKDVAAHHVTMAADHFYEYLRPHMVVEGC